jgi:hypothetical protein
VVGEAVTDKAELALLDILLDGVEWFFLGDLHLGVGPTRNLNNHVQDALALVNKQRNIMEGRDRLAILFDEYTVLWHLISGG